jgi:AcrR family transcriptional regulator
MKRVNGRKKNSRSRILRVATTLFAQRGFVGTTTREIARRAGVNPALVFYFFGNKEKLYYAVYDELWKTSKWYEQRRHVYQNGPSDPAVITRVAQELLTGLQEDDTVLRLGLFAGLDDSPGSRRLSERIFRTYVSETYELLAVYIRQRIREGEFRELPPILAARAFIGIVVYQHIIQEYLGGKHSDEFSSKEMARVVADIWLYGVRAHTPMPTRN